MAQDSLHLLQGVREVAAIVSPAEPEAITQRAFDAERERSPSHADLPPARRITERLGLGWREVLAVAHEPEEDQNKLLALKDKAPSSASWLSEKHIAAVLQLVAGRLGADTVSSSEYQVEREKVLAEARARWLHGRNLLLPTERQITYAAGSWDEALRFAGLRDQRKPGATRKKTNAPRLVDLMERFYEAHGVEPTRPTLQEWASASGIPYPSPQGQGRNAFRNAKKAWIERRREDGLPEPKPPSHARGRSTAWPDYSTKKGKPLPGERRRDHWDRDSCVAAVARYIAQLPPGKRSRSSSRGYRAWAVEQEHAPVMTTIRYHCKSWEKARRAALAQVS
jgi:hypothetical protein